MLCLTLLYKFNVFSVLAVARVGHGIGLKGVFLVLHQLASLIYLFELFKPLKVQDFLERRTFRTVLLEHRSAGLLARLTYFVPGIETEVRGVLDCLARNFFLILIVEGKHLAQQQVGDHTQ